MAPDEWGDGKWYVETIMAMRLEIAVSGDGPGRWAAGIVVIDQAGACGVVQAGQRLDEAGDEQTALYMAMLAGLGAAAVHQPDELEIRCASGPLVQRITGGQELDADELHQQVMMQLLRFDIWRMVAVDPSELARPLELAGQALGLSESQIAAARPVAPSPVEMRWTVELTENPGRDCPAGCRPGMVYEVGSTVPAGLCVHAARAALLDGPLNWDAPDQTRMTTYCEKCDVPIQIIRL